MTINNASRREFLRRAAVMSGSVGAAGLPFAMNLACMNAAVAQTTDYKAVVCLFLYGGNDSANMVLPTDTASWATYNTVRNTGSDPIALKAVGTVADIGASGASPAGLGGVLPIVPDFTAFAAQNNARTYALHPAMTGVKSLFDAGRLAVIANAGPLVTPITRVEYRARTKATPAKLFSHNDQQSTWQALGPEGTRVGWGGRFGDLLASQNDDTTYTNIAVDGNAVFMAGNTVFQYRVGTGGAVAIAGTTGNLFNSAVAATTYRSLITQNNAPADATHLLVREQATIAKRSMDAQAKFQAAYQAVTPLATTQYLQPSTRSNQNNGFATVLQTVARIIGARAGLGAKRQVFFVSLGGFDTHDNQNVQQADLLARLSHAIDYFDKALAALGMQNNVTLFTGSDFGRTFTTNGDGTDHGWGAHHFVYGGAVKGKEIYGRFPQVGLEQPDEVGSGAFLPGVSVDQIGGTIGKWFGVSDTNLNMVFPNLTNFQRDLGFMKPA